MSGLELGRFAESVSPVQLVGLSGVSLEELPWFYGQAGRRRAIGGVPQRSPLQGQPELS